MSDRLKRWLIFLGILAVGIVVYIYPKARITPKDKMAALSGAKAYSKTAPEDDLKSLPPGKYICTVLTISDQVRVSTSCRAIQDMDPEERRAVCRD
jgi:hypothetical protein